MVWLGKWGVGCGGMGFELSVVRDGVGIRSAFHMSSGLGMEWCGLGMGRVDWDMVRGMCVVE